MQSFWNSFKPMPTKKPKLKKALMDCQKDGIFFEKIMVESASPYRIEESIPLKDSWLINAMASVGFMIPFPIY